MLATDKNYSFQRNNNYEKSSFGNKQKSSTGNQFSDGASHSNSSEDDFTDDQNDLMRRNQSQRSNQINNYNRNTSSINYNNNPNGDVDEDEDDGANVNPHEGQLGYSCFKQFRGTTVGRHIKRHTLLFATFFFCEGVTFLTLSIMEDESYYFTEYLSEDPNSKFFQVFICTLMGFLFLHNKNNREKNILTTTFL